MRTKSYFDMHAHHQAYHKAPLFYAQIMDHLKFRLDNGNNKIKVLDLGCGDGSFIKNLIAGGINAEFIGSDVSSSMIDIAKEKLDDQNNVEWLVCDGFELPLISRAKFDVIHLDSVLHHLVGKTRSKSRCLSNRLLAILINRLSKNGILIVEEMYYNSYLIPQITSFFVFYALKLLSMLKLDLSKFTSLYQPGLEVNFFCDKQIEGMLKNYGDSVYMIKRSPDAIPKLFRMLLLKDWGHISYSVKAPSS